MEMAVAGVGVQLALVGAGVQRGEQLRRQRVAGGVGAGVQPDQQRGERLALGHRGLPDEDVAGHRGVAQLALQVPPRSGGRQHRDRQQRDQNTSSQTARSSRVH